MTTPLTAPESLSSVASVDAATVAYALTTSTPDGPFTFIATTAEVLASGWTEKLDELLPLIHASLRPARASIAVLTPADLAGGGVVLEGGESSKIEVVQGAHRALTAYYDGDASVLAEVPVRQKSGPFREHAWDVLRTVAPGEVVTYTQYAERSGRPAAVRAAASACAMNAAALFVPCHRVLRTDGSLGGFRYGLAIKESLLTREGLER